MRRMAQAQQIGNKKLISIDYEKYIREKVRSIMEISERDWKQFRAKLPIWQEAYMKRLCEEYVALLSSDNTPSEKFRALEKRIREDKKNPGVCADMRRSEMVFILLRLLNDGVITRADLSEFSQDLQDTAAFLVKNE